MPRKFSVQQITFCSQIDSIYIIYLCLRYNYPNNNPNMAGKIWSHRFISYKFNENGEFKSSGWNHIEIAYSNYWDMHFKKEWINCVLYMCVCVCVCTAIFYFVQFKMQRYLLSLSSTLLMDNKYEHFFNIPGISFHFISNKVQLRNECREIVLFGLRAIFYLFFSLLIGKKFRNLNIPPIFFHFTLNKV